MVHCVVPLPIADLSFGVSDLSIQYRKPHRIIFKAKHTRNCNFVRTLHAKNCSPYDECGPMIQRRLTMSWKFILSEDLWRSVRPNPPVFLPVLTRSFAVSLLPGVPCIRRRRLRLVPPFRLRGLLSG